MARQEGAKRKDPVKLAKLARDVEQARANVAYTDKAVQQRGEQFRIMREDVFHTDKAAAQSRARLQFRSVDPRKRAQFDERAARLSTPEQVAALEEELAG
jgi:Spy/CpxP family protein refolding chaperone